MSITPDGRSIGAPLAGVKVLDFTRVLSGPYCTALLADLGADVVKVESPLGDEYRHIGPFRDGESALFQLVNRNKESIRLDLKLAADRTLAVRLAARADVVVENFRPGVAARLGIGYAELSEQNPRLIYASISGFGQTGPRSEWPAFDLVAQAMSGFMALTGERDGPPTKIGESIGDLSAGLFCSWAVLAALFERANTGHGRRIDVGMVDALVSLLPTAVAQWMFGEAPPSRSGNRHPISTPFGAYAASDGHLVICVLSAAHFAQLMNCMGRPELGREPRFATDALRTHNEAELSAMLEDWLSRLTVEEALRLLREAGVPASPIDSPDEVFRGEHVRERSILSATAHPVLGSIPAMEQPVHFGGLPRGRQRAAPALDQHREAILGRWLNAQGEVR